LKVRDDGLYTKNSSKLIEKMQEEKAMDATHKHPFYGYEIFRDGQEDYIKELLKKYEKEPVTQELRKKIWDELQMEKYHGRVTIPFKVVMRIDATKKFPDYIEVILDTKV
jgi:hypothetical protein